MTVSDRGARFISVECQVPPCEGFTTEFSRLKWCGEMKKGLYLAECYGSCFIMIYNRALNENAIW